jgi:NAD-dependent dihydropyrimidine dehydrogenase PreA subunit
MFLRVIIIYIILLYFAVEVSWLWPLGIISVLGFLLETTRMRGWFAPPFKITRNTRTCIDCKLCDARCPMGIEVSTADPVTDIDCHLCGDCIESCPVPEVLQINKKERRWLPAAATVILIGIALFLATTIELPTINMRWAKETELSKAKVYTQSGLRSVKCFGSASSFATRMRQVPGVLGVEAFVQSHTVKIYYNPEKTTAEKVRKSIFTPAKTVLRKLPPGIDSLAVVEMGIDQLFDSYDNFYFTQLLKQHKGVYGLKTVFGEPVKAVIYYSDSITTPEAVKAQIESEEVHYVSRGKKYSAEVDFGVDYIKPRTGYVSKMKFIRDMFRGYDQAFNKYRKYPKDSIAV